MTAQIVNEFPVIRLHDMVLLVQTRVPNSIHIQFIRFEEELQEQTDGNSLSSVISCYALIFVHTMDELKQNVTYLLRNVSRKVRINESDVR